MLLLLLRQERVLHSVVQQANLSCATDCFSPADSYTLHAAAFAIGYSVQPVRSRSTCTG
jgi:hypothetical protein